MLRKETRSFMKLFSLLMCVTLLLSVFSGCQQKSGVDVEVKQGTVETPKEPLKIKMVARINPEVILENNPIIKEAERLNNVKLEIEAPPLTGYSDKLNMIMASGDYPDLAYIQNIDAKYIMWAKEGILLALDEYVNKYPNLKNNIKKELYDVTKVFDTGKIHAIPKTNKYNYGGMVINHTWLDKLKLEVPNTPDELMKVLKAFTYNDPDGNGKKDTYGFTMVYGGAFSNPFIMSAFNLANLGNADVDGKYKIHEKFLGYYPYLTFLRKMVSEEKVVDPEFFLDKTYGDRDKLLQKKVGIIAGTETAPYGPEVQAISPDNYKNYTFAPPLKDEKGGRTLNMGAPVWGAWSIVKTAKDPERIAKFLDWANSEEGFILMACGIKGIHYNSYDLKTRVMDSTPEQKKLVQTYTSSYLTFSFAFNGDPSVAAPGDGNKDIEAKYIKEMDFYKKNTKINMTPPVTAPLMKDFAKTEPDLDKKKKDLVFKYVMGEITLEQLKAFMEGEYFKKVDAAEKEYIEYMNRMK